jgi:hypothetical protein
LAERARLVLQAEAGLSTQQVAASLGLSEQVVAGALEAFEQQRLAGFPRPHLEPEQFLELRPEQIAQARHVTGLAQRLFSATRALHHLPGKTKRLLECAALLWPLVRLSGARRDQDALQPGLELLEGATLAGFGAREQAAISCVLRLQRRGYRPDLDASFKRLRPTQQGQVRQLAALLQTAGGLDHSRSQSTALLGADISAESVTLRLSGPNAESDGAQACRLARLWRPVFHVTLRHAIGPSPITSVNGSSPGVVDGDIPLTAIISRELAQALRVWQASLAGALAGDSAGLGGLLESVDQARVTLGAFASILKRQALQRVRKPLRNLEDLLGSIVNQQTALAELEAFRSRQSSTAAAELLPLQEAWERNRRRRQADLKAWLEGAEATTLFTNLTAVAEAPPLRRSKVTTVAAGAAILLDEQCAKLVAREAKFSDDHPKSYWRYRQGLARLACTLKVWGESVSDGKEVAQLMADLRRLQGRLDRLLANISQSEAIAEFLDNWAEQQARRKAPQLHGAQPVLAYRQARRVQWSRLRGSLRRDWRVVRAGRLRRRVAQLLKRSDGD